MGSRAQPGAIPGPWGGKNPGALCCPGTSWQLPAHRRDLYKAEGAFLFPSFPFSLGRAAFWMWLLGQTVSLLCLLCCGNTHLGRAEQSPALSEVEFPAALMGSLNVLMEYVKGKLWYLLISSKLWLPLVRHEGRRRGRGKKKGRTRWLGGQQAGGKLEWSTHLKGLLFLTLGILLPSTSQLAKSRSGAALAQPPGSIPSTAVLGVILGLWLRHVPSMERAEGSREALVPGACPGSPLGSASWAGVDPEPLDR